MRPGANDLREGAFGLTQRLAILSSFTDRDSQPERARAQ
jgi:hypothetical protein